MSVKIRLARGGAKKRPFYRIVVADSRTPRDGRFIEKVGTYDPMLTKDHPNRITLNAERIKHWLSVGAQPTERVARFLGQAELAPMPVWRETPKKSAPKAKAQERLKEAKEAAEAAAAAPAAPAVEEVAVPAEEPVAEAPAEEVAEAPVEEAAEAPAEEVAEAPAEEVAEAPAEEVAEAPAEEVAEAPVEEVAEAPADETAEAPAEEASEDEKEKA